MYKIKNDIKNKKLQCKLKYLIIETGKYAKI